MGKTKPSLMTRAQLNEIRSAAFRATPGPWYAHNPDDRSCMNMHCVTTSPREPDTNWIDTTGEENAGAQEIVALTLLQDPRVVDHASQNWEENAAFIAAAREGVPALLAHIAALEAEIEAAQQAPLSAILMTSERAEELQRRLDEHDARYREHDARYHVQDRRLAEIEATLPAKDAEIDRLRRVVRGLLSAAQRCQQPECAKPATRDDAYRYLCDEHGKPDRGAQDRGGAWAIREASALVAAGDAAAPRTNELSPGPMTVSRAVAQLFDLVEYRGIGADSRALKRLERELERLRSIEATAKEYREARKAIAGHLDDSVAAERSYAASVALDAALAVPNVDEEPVK